VRASLLTTGTDQISGGHRYHQHLLAAAPEMGFELSLAPPKLARALPSADVVLIDSLYAWKFTGAVRHHRRPPVVAIVHQHPGGSDGAGWARRLRRRLDVATYRRCELVITPGPIVADLLTTEYGLDPTRIEVIEPGCDLAPVGRVPALRGARRLGLLSVANWLPNKGIIELLEAVANLPSDEVTLHLAGRTDLVPEYTDRVRRRIERPDLSNRAVVHGGVDSHAIAALLAASDAFAFPSLVETYGTAAAEALAAGVPVVGWRTPHLTRLVDDQIEGLLVAPGSIAGLTAAIHRLAVDGAERSRLAEGARRRGERLPTWRQTTTRFFDALSRLLAEPVEPPHAPPIALDVDPADTGILDEQSVGHRHRDIQGPRQRGLDRADMRDDDHH
jgi:glycosyltransferase involved in cell wall biosynthesis